VQYRAFGRAEPLVAAQSAARQSRPVPVKMTEADIILMEVGHSRFGNVKVMTDEPGWYGVGDGNHALRVAGVGQIRTHVSGNYLRPFYLDSSPGR